MKPLLPAASLQYLRRLAVELNHHAVNGFFEDGDRFTQARFSRGNLQIRRAGAGWENAPPDADFRDAHRNPIVAPRET